MRKICDQVDEIDKREHKLLEVVEELGLLEIKL